MSRSFSSITAHFNDGLDGLIGETEKKIAALRKRRRELCAARSPFRVRVKVRVMERSRHMFAGPRWRTDSFEKFGRITNAQSLDTLICEAGDGFRKEFPKHKEADFQIDLLPLLHESCTIPYQVGKEFNVKVAGLALRYFDPAPRYA